MTHESMLRRTLIIVLGFNALSQIGGGIALVTGVIAPPLSLLAGTPFSDYAMPGLILGVVAGGGSLVALALVWVARRTTGDLAGFVSGGTTAGWIVGEVILLGVISWPLQVLYLVTGLFAAALAAALWLADAENTHLHQPLHRHATV